jgi:catechol 2,3-dioxygenase-like lactoylglutathione lyase family enzyme
VGIACRISSVTLACHDLERMTAFYRQFDWPEAPTSVPEHVVFQCDNGVVLGLFSQRMFEADRGPVAVGFRGFSLSIMVEDIELVIDAHRRLSGFDDIFDLDPEPQRSGFGCGFSFRDPEGNVWDVAHKYGSDFDQRGGYVYP